MNTLKVGASSALGEIEPHALEVSLLDVNRVNDVSSDRARRLGDLFVGPNLRHALRLDEALEWVIEHAQATAIRPLAITDRDGVPGIVRAQVAGSRGRRLLRTSRRAIDDAINSRRAATIEWIVVTNVQ